MVTYETLLTTSTCSKRGVIGCSRCGLYDSEENCVEEISKTAIALADMLKRLEFSNLTWDGSECAICGGRNEHEEDCELAALLKEMEVEG